MRLVPRAGAPGTGARRRTSCLPRLLCGGMVDGGHGGRSGYNAKWHAGRTVVCVCLCRYPLPLGRVHSHTPRGSLPAYSVLIVNSCINLILYNRSRVGGILKLVAVAGSDRGVAAAAVAVSIEVVAALR